MPGGRSGLQLDRPNVPRRSRVTILSRGPSGRSAKRKDGFSNVDSRQTGRGSDRDAKAGSGAPETGRPSKAGQRKLQRGVDRVRECAGIRPPEGKAPTAFYRKAEKAVQKVAAVLAERGWDKHLPAVVQAIEQGRPDIDPTYRPGEKAVAELIRLALDKTTRTE